MTSAPSRPTGRTTTPTGSGPARGLRVALLTSDPGLGRLRSAVTTVVVLAVTAGVVAGGALLAGGPLTVAVTGVVLAFVTGIAGRDLPFSTNAAVTGWTALGVAVSSAVSALVGGAASAAGIVVFVALAVTAMFLQRLGPQGFAPGMAAFITFLATSLTGLSLSGLPLAIGATVLGALTVIAMRRALRVRHPERAARHAVDAAEARAGQVMLALADELDAGDTDRARRRIRRRLGALRRTTAVVDDQLAATDSEVVAGLSGRALGVRVFDLRLGVEHLADLLVPDRLATEDVDPAAGADLAVLLREVGRALLTPRDEPGRWRRVDATEVPPSGRGRVRRTVMRIVEDWRRPADDLDGDPGDAGDVDAADDADGGSGGPPPVSDTARRAVQVALAVALTAWIGQWVSPMQWYFAVVVAFVVFVSSSSRGAVLDEGWRRLLGTLLGVIVGIGLAALLDGNTTVPVLLVAVCVFGALYVVGLSSTALMVFITVAIALVYGLIGRPTFDLLLLRLAETAVGAGIGIAVSFLVLPNRTRTSVADALARYLRALRGVIDESVEVLACRGEAGAVVQSVDEGIARELRDALTAVDTAAGPLTDGPAGLWGREGHRDARRVVGSCDHHARLLLRLARGHGTSAGIDEETARALRDAAGHVAGRATALADTLDRRSEGTPAGDDEAEHGRLLGALDEAAHRRAEAEGNGEERADRATDTAGAHPDGERITDGDVLRAVGGRLRAIDRALTEIDGRR